MILEYIECLISPVNMSIKLLVQSLIFNLVYTLTPREFRKHYVQIINNLKNNYHYKYGDDVCGLKTPYPKRECEISFTSKYWKLHFSTTIFGTRTSMLLSKCFVIVAGIFQKKTKIVIILFVIFFSSPSTCLCS